MMWYYSKPCPWCDGINDAIQENTPSVKTERNMQDGPVEASVAESELKVTVERELVSQAEEEDTEALLGTYVFLSFYLWGC